MMRHLLIGLLAFLLAAPAAHAQSTKAQLNTEITATFIDNTVGAITPAGLRAVTSDIVNSIMPTAPVVTGNLACFNGTTGLLQDCGLAPSGIFTGLSGDCTATLLGVITCTKTNGVLFGTMAVQNANAVAITGGAGLFTTQLDYSNTQNASTNVSITNTSTGANALSGFIATNSASNANFGIGGTSYAGQGGNLAGKAFVFSNTGAAGIALYTTGAAPIDFYVNGTRAGGFTSGGLLTLTTALAVGQGGTGGTAASGTLLDNITGFASTGFISRTGAGTYSFTGSTGSGSVVLSTSPTITSASLVTPALGVATATSLAINGATIGSNGIAVTGSSSFTGAMIVSSTSSSAFTAGAGGGSNPALQVDASAGSAATGIKITAFAAGSGSAITTISSGTNENLAINAKGSGTIAIGNSSTGAVTITPNTTHSGTTTLSAALTYGGVTLSNSVTGTGSMALSAGPTFTGTVTTAALNGTAITASTSISSPIHLASGALTFQSNGGTTAGVISTGQLWTIGSGATAPSGAHLMVSGQAVAPPTLGFNSSVVINDADATNSRLTMSSVATNSGFNNLRANGTSASPTAVATGNSLATYFAHGYATAASAGYVLTAGSGFTITATDNYTTTTAGARFDIGATPAGTATLQTSVSVGAALMVGTTTDGSTGQILMNNASFLMRNKTAWTNGGGGGTTPTLGTNGPTGATTPTKWIPVDDNGTTRYVPSW